MTRRLVLPLLFLLILVGTSLAHVPSASANQHSTFELYAYGYGDNRGGGALVGRLDYQNKHEVNTRYTISSTCGDTNKHRGRWTVEFMDGSTSSTSTDNIFCGSDEYRGYVLKDAPAKVIKRARFELLMNAVTVKSTGWEYNPFRLN